jgi:hypothetical protein
MKQLSVNHQKTSNKINSQNFILFQFESAFLIVFYKKKSLAILIKTGAFYTQAKNTWECTSLKLLSMN